ncbi:MAG: thiamine biosynthesis protein ThiS, partial [Theionarchaea archaeon]|nr:thiamine biosynthesis protein ThiS [Theionarchaea archaeon]
GKPRSLSVPAGCRAGDLLRSMGLLREEYVVLKDEKVVYEFEKLVDGDNLRLIRAFSGG